MFSTTDPAAQTTAHPQPRTLRRVLTPTLALTLGSAASLSLIVAGAAPAAASPATVPSPVIVSATGAFSGNVPDGVCAVSAMVLGGAGGSAIATSGANGGGSRVLGTFSVVPGMTYSGTVGGGGEQAGANGGPGGSNGGGTGGITTTGVHPGSGGGGWTALQLGTTLAILAGGGGGSSGGHSTNGGFGGNAGLPAGVGVAAGSTGLNGADTASATVGAGQGGQPGAPGAGGVNSADASLNGLPGSGRTGGDGGLDPTPDSGGGGGGGWFGGGGGSSTVGNGSGGSIPGGIAGGGGGGGTSYVASSSPDGSGTAPTAVSSSVGPKLGGTGNGADGAVQLNWVACDYDLAVTKSANPASGPVGTTVTWTIAVTNNGSDAMTKGDTVTLTDSLPGAGAKTITDIAVTGGNNAVLSRGPVTCNAAVGDPMPATLTCTRPYAAPGADEAPSGGTRGIDPGETITVSYQQTVPGPNGTVMNNTATVDDRASGDGNDSATASVTTVAVPPTATPDTSSGPQGVAQSVDPMTNDVPGDSPLVPASLTLLDGGGNPAATVTIPGQGVYSIDAQNRIVFTPEPSFVGTATPADYRIGDTNGNTATSTYTPTLTGVSPTASPDETDGPQGAPQSVDPLANDNAGDPGVPLDPATLTLLNAGGNPVASVAVPNQGTYTVSGGQIVFTPEPHFVGTATPVDYRVADANGTTTTSTYTPTVTAVTQPDDTTGPQGLPQSVDPLANDTLDPGVTLDPTTLTLIDPSTGNPVGSVTIPGQGTYTVSGGDLVFTPQPDFVGTADPVTYQVADTDGNPLQNTYTPTVVPVTPSATPDETDGPQGVPQSVDPLVNDTEGDPGVPLDPGTLTLLDGGGNPVGSVVIPGQGTYTINAQDRIVFTPAPDFVGTATPVDYRVADANGTTTTSTYTPTFNPVNPTANPDETEGPQGAPQSIDPLANDTEGDASVPLDAGTLTLLDAGGNPVGSVVIPGQGTYTINAQDRIVFTPAPDFIGAADPVDYRVSDTNGTTTTSTYTPTVTPVAQPDESEGPQGLPQTVDPLANDDVDPAVTLDPTTLMLIDPATGDPAAAVTIPNQGTYTVDNGQITFQPLPAFTGTATPITYEVDDTDGNTVSSTYTPTVTPVSPGANPDSTNGPQGVAQSIDPLANDLPGDPGVPFDASTLTLVDGAGDPVASVTIAGQGTYTINAQDRIVFTPEADFVGSATPVDYRVADANGTTTTSTYTPTLNPVTPVASPDQSSGRQGAAQSVNPLANDAPGDASVPLDPASLTLLDGAGDPVASVTVPGQGTYTIEDGRIVFTPLPDFVGEATPVDYQVADTNGTVATSTYTPTVSAVEPTARPDRTHGPLNQPQSVNPFGNDRPGDPEVPLDKDSLTLLDQNGNPVDRVRIPGEGVYSVVGGRIVFTPQRGFTGTATPAGYRIADVNGTTTTSTYTPTVVAGPAEEVGVITNSGPVGTTVEVDPVAQVPGLLPESIYLVGPDGEHVMVLVVPGEGTWSVDPETGVVTFTPEAGFRGNPTPVDFGGFKADGTPVTGVLKVSYYPPNEPALPDTGSSPWLVPLGGLGALALAGGVLLLRRRGSVSPA